MHPIYETRTVEPAQIDRWLALPADNRSEFIRIEPEATPTIEAACRRLAAEEIDRMIRCDRQSLIDPIDSTDVLIAAARCNLTLGILHISSERSDAVLWLNMLTIDAARAWATVSRLPDWLVEGYEYVLGHRAGDPVYVDQRPG